MSYFGLARLCLLPRLYQRTLHTSASLNIKDNYKILVVSRDVDSNAAKKTYYEKAKQFHPITHTSKLITLPNIITMSRIACSPAIGYFIWTGMHQHALACFAFAAATDLLDGLIARVFKQESDFGVVFDPLADKILLTTCFIAMYNVDMLPLWLVQGFVTRDIFLVVGAGVLRYFAFTEPPTMKKYFDIKNYPSIGFEPTLTSKCNTALQCLIIVIHLSTNHLVGNMYYDLSVKALHWVTAITTVASTTQYLARTTGPSIGYKARSKTRVKE